MRQLWAAAFLLAAVAALSGNSVAQPPSSSESQRATQPVNPQADLEKILSNMERVQWENPARYRAYMLTREYKFFQGNDTQSPKSEVTAQVAFEPPNKKHFDILETRGSGRGESVVKHILENEAEVSKDVSSAEFTRRNYDFALLGESAINGRRCFVLDLQPKRQERSLFVGKLWIAADDYHLLRAEGRPAKSPSWWLKSSYVVLDFGDVDGLWLPVATHGTGEVRIFGHFQLESRKLSQQVAGVTAQSRFKQQNRRTVRPSAALGAVIPEPPRQ